MNTKEIKEYYFALSDEKLMSLLPEIAEMHPDVLQSFRAELEKRRMIEETKLIDEFISSNNIENTILDRDDIHKEVRERLENGETIEEIKFDLKMRGIDILKLAGKEQDEEDTLFHIMTGMKENGLTNVEINRSLNKDLGFSEAQSNELVNELEKRGKQNITIGNILVVFSIVMEIIFISMGKLSLLAIGIFAVGIWRHQLGKKQLKSN